MHKKLLLLQIFYQCNFTLYVHIQVRVTCHRCQIMHVKLCVIWHGILVSTMMCFSAMEQFYVVVLVNCVCTSVF